MPLPWKGLHMKALRPIIAGLVIVVICAGIAIGSLFWSRLPDLLASTLSKKMRVAVSVHAVDARWEKILVDQVQVANVPKSVLANALTCNQILILAPYLAYLQSQIIVDEIDLNGVYLGLEFDSASGTSGNWSTIMNNIKASGMRHPKKSTEGEPSHTLLIHKLVLTDIDTDVVYRKEGSKIHKLPRIPRIELNEISSEGDFPINQLMDSVLGSLLKEVFMKQNLNNMLQNLLKPQKVIPKHLLPFGDFLNASPKNEDVKACSR